MTIDRLRAVGTVDHAQLWANVCEMIDGLAPSVVLRCWQMQVAMTRLRGLTPRYAWTLDITAPGEGAWDSLAHMHIGFISSDEWVLLGYCDGDYRLVVDKSGTVRPGLRQGFIYDRKRREADVILTMSKDQMWDAILSQIDILGALEGQEIDPILPRPRYA